MQNSLAHCYPIVAIGGSAGALEPLLLIVSDLPADFSACVFVVIHTPADAVSSLPTILAKSSHMFAAHALDGAPLAPGRIIVAPPDSHLMIQGGAMRVGYGPKENRSRPSIDVLFRSVARECGKDAIGVILSGALDDGVDGLRAIKDAGGATIVQDPQEALFTGMPQAAISADVADAVLPPTAIARHLCDEVAGLAHRNITPATRPVTHDERKEGQPSVFTCPDCSGTLWEMDIAGDLRFRCRTGHAYSAASLLSGQTDGIEHGLWKAVRALEERADLFRKLGKRAALRKDDLAVQRFERRAAAAQNDIEQVQDALNKLMTRPRTEA